MMTPDQIHELRKSLGLTQERFAQLLGVSWTTVNRWEAGQSGPTGMAMRILLLLQARIADHDLKSALAESRTQDPMFVLYKLLGQVYETNPGRRQSRGGSVK